MIKKPFCFFFLLSASLSLTGPAWAERETSLFFSPREVQSIESRQKEAPYETNAPCHVYLKLDSLLFFGTENWTAWLNGERLEAQNRPKEWEGFRLLGVSAQGLTFQKGKQGIPFTLAPQEAYDRLREKKLPFGKLPSACRTAPTF